MNETSSWDPPTGRYPVRVGATMLHYLGLGPEPAEDYYAFKYMFRPQSFDKNAPGDLTSDPTSKNKFTFVQQSPVTNENLVWNVTQQPKKYQCILLYDEQASEWTLERLETQLLLNHNRGKNASKATATPPATLTALQPTSSTPPASTSLARPTATPAAEQAQIPRNETSGPPSRGNVARPPRIPASAPSNSPSANPIPHTVPATTAAAAPSSSRTSVPTLKVGGPPSSVPKAKPQPHPVAKAKATVPKPIPTPQDSIISLGTALTPRAPAISSPLALPRSAATTPVVPAFAPVAPIPSAPEAEDEEEEEEEEEEPEEDLVPAGAPAIHPLLVHQSDDSDDEEDEEDILGLGHDDAEGDGDVEGEVEGPDDDDFEDFLAADLRESVSSTSPANHSAPVAASNSARTQTQMPPLATRNSLPIRPPPPIIQHRAVPPAPPPERPMTLSQLAGGAPTRPMSLHRLAGGHTGDTDDEESSSEGD